MTHREHLLYASCCAGAFIYATHLITLTMKSVHTCKDQRALTLNCNRGELAGALRILSLPHLGRGIIIL